MLPNKSNQISRLIDDTSKSTEVIFDDPVLESHQDKKSLLSDLVNPLGENKIKPVPSRIDYNFFNYCSICELKYPKQILRCRDCNQKLRTRPWHRSKIIDRKRI
ncbi:MAG TPA: hypothetical protein VE548_15725 [Nitrososphaeraceae archaeon]|jgi:hypothetical protein|nr:hypothetical protein [Nitrososphaeraceae archaeon]